MTPATTLLPSDDDSRTRARRPSRRPLRRQSNAAVDAGKPVPSNAPRDHANRAKQVIEAAEDTWAKVIPTVQAHRPIARGRRGTDSHERLAMPKGQVLTLPNGLQTFIHDFAGPPNAPVVFLLHGWTVDARLNWESCIEDLTKNYRVLTIDHRGHGQGIRTPDKKFTLEDCADDVAAVAKTLHVEKFTAVGYSMGGPIAMLCVERHPQLVEGVVFAATNDHFVQNRIEKFSLACGVAFGRVTSSVTPEEFRDHVYRSCMRAFVYTRRKINTDEADREFAKNDPVMLLNAGHALIHFDRQHCTPRLRIPIGFVVTADDHAVPTAKQYAFIERLETASGMPVSVHRIETGHHAPIDAPDLFSAGLFDAICHVQLDIARAREMSDTLTRVRAKIDHNTRPCARTRLDDPNQSRTMTALLDNAAGTEADAVGIAL